jgi:Glycosyl hydrolase family 26
MPTPDNPAFHSYIGYYPDYTTNNSFMDPSCSLGENIRANNGYPVVVANSHYGGGTNYTASGQFGNEYLSAYTAGIEANIVPYGATVYAFRLSREWCLSSNDWSPYHTPGSYSSPSVSVGTWIGGWQNYVNMLRNISGLGNVKVAWDYPLMADSHRAADPLAYYPGDEYVDIISADPYFISDWYGGTSSSVWNFYTTWGSLNLNSMAAFAAEHNKPMAFWEWADNYGDGYCINQFGSWTKAHNVVAQSYWDETGNYSNGGLQDTTANVNAYVSQFGSSAYNGTFWPVQIALPSIKPAGF